MTVDLENCYDLNKRKPHPAHNFHTGLPFIIAFTSQEEKKPEKSRSESATLLAEVPRHKWSVRPKGPNIELP